MTSWVYFRNLAGEVAENHLEMIQRENSQRANGGMVGNGYQGC